MKRSLLGLMILIVGILVVSGCVKEEKFTGPVEKVRIALTTNALSTLLWVADSQGYFAKHGLDVTFHKYESGLGTIKSLFEGEADLATTVEFVLASQLLERDDLRIVSAISTADIIEIIARRDRVQDLPDLVGKKIGLVQESMSPFLLAGILIQEGISYDAVTVVDMIPPKMEGALSSGEVDAVVIWSPIAINIKDSMEGEVLSWSSQTGQELHWLLFGFKDWIETHPTAQKRLLGALIEAEAFVEANEDATKNILAEAFEKNRAHIDHVVWPGHKPGVSLSQSLILVLEDEARWAIRNNLTDATEVPNYLDYIYLDVLDEVKPEAVTIIR